MFILSHIANFICENSLPKMVNWQQFQFLTPSHQSLLVHHHFSIKFSVTWTAKCSLNRCSRRDWVKARYDTLLAGLKLKAAAGVLSEEDVLAVNGLLGR